MADWKADLWTYPGAGPFELVWANIPFSEMTVTPRRGRIGDASMTLPNSRDIIDDLLPLMLTRDPQAPANDRRSLVRVYRAGETVPAAEWVPTVIPDSLGQESITVTGETYGPYRLSDAVVWPFDWPAWLFPDWVWGGRNVLQNPGFEDGAPLPEVQRVWVSGATGGTFTLSDGVDTTLPIAWNASAATVKTRLETDITAIVAVDVEGSGTSTDPWRVTWSNPLGPFNQLACDGTLLTPGGAFCNVAPEMDGLTAQITGWTPSQAIYGGQHGSHAAGSPRLSIPPGEPADTGTYAAFYDADSPFGGIEQRISVQPGQVYSGARIRVRPDSAANSFALVLRDRYEGLITGTPPSKVSGTFPTGSYSTQEIPGIHVIGDGVYELTFRHAYVGSGDASGVLVDNANLTLGLQPATVGEMVRLLWEDAAVNHVADGRVVLDNLDLTFTDAVDSDGTPWPRVESFTVTHGQSYYQVMESLKEQLGYGWSITPKATPAGALTHDLNVYVPGGDGTVRTADADPAIIIGGGVAAGPVSHAVVAGNAVLAEGADGLSARAESAASIGAAGRREVYVPVGEATSQDTVSALASSQLDELLAQGLGFAVEIPDGAGPTGLVDYGLGDTVNVLHPTLGRVGYRADSHEVRIRPDGARGVTHFSREILHADAAVYEGVRRLLARTASQPPPAPKPAVRQDDKATGGGAPTLVVAAADASAESKARADFVCTGAGDEATINTAIRAVAAVGGRILLTEGTFAVSVAAGGLILEPTVTLQGMGESTVVEAADDPAISPAPIVTAASQTAVRDLAVSAFFGSNPQVGVRVDGNTVRISGCRFSCDGPAVFSDTDCSGLRLLNCVCGNPQLLAVTGTGSGVRVVDCAIEGIPPG